MTKEVFDATWLALREPADHRSRALALLPLLNVVWSRAHWSRVLDFGSGTGSNLRYLGPKLPDGQEWTLVDHDPDLLALATIPARVRGLKHVCGDVADEGLELVKEAHLVTGSALLDLVSEDWLRDLVEECRLAECGVLFALSYDGSITWDLGQGVDEDPGDVLVWNAVNKHQRRDKGLGPALGPTAGSVAQKLFLDAGYRTWFLPSPWHLNQHDSGLTSALVDGWQHAALEQNPGQEDHIRTWAERRVRQVASEGFGLNVGHVDFLALPDVSS